MQLRKLGEAGPEVPELGFGCLGLSSGYTETDDAAAERTIHRAIEMGVRHFDTADAYGNGHSEKLVGRALADRRDQITIATKFGHIMQDDGQRVICGRPEYVKTACDASLARLGIAYVAYSPLGRGFLSGTIKATGDLREGDRRRALPRFTSKNLDSNVARIETLTDVAVEVGASPSQVALAWVLAQRRFIHPIPGTTSITHLEENMGAADLTLSDEQLQRLAHAFDAVAGERYPPAAMERVQL